MPSNNLADKPTVIIFLNFEVFEIFQKIRQKTLSYLNNESRQKFSTDESVPFSQKKVPQKGTSLFEVLKSNLFQKQAYNTQK